MPIEPKQIGKSRYWYGRGTHLGVSIDRTTGIPVEPGAVARSEALARSVCRKWEREIEGIVIHGKKPPLLFATAAERYMIAGGSPRFLPALLDFCGDKIACEDIDDQFAAMAAKAILRPGFAAATYNRHIATPLRAVIKAAGVPCSLKSRKVAKTAKRWLTPEEFGAIIDGFAIGGKAPGRTEEQAIRGIAILSFLVGTGCRPGEMAALPRSQLFMATGEARILPLAGSGKTDNADRMVSYPDRANAALARYLADQGSIGAAVFNNGLAGRRRGPINTAGDGASGIKTMFAAAVRRAGIDPQGVTPYTLRHTWATWHYAQCRDLPLLQFRGGWSDVSMAMHYTKLAPADLATRCIAHGWIFEGGKYQGTQNSVRNNVQ